MPAHVIALEAMAAVFDIALVCVRAGVGAFEAVWFGHRFTPNACGKYSTHPLAQAPETPVASPQDFQLAPSRRIMTIRRNLAPVLFAA